LEQLKMLVNEPALASNQVLPVLMSLRSSEEETRAWACDVLSGVEHPPEAIASQLAELTLDGCSPVAGWACKLLGRMSQQATEYQAAIVASLNNHPEISVRQLAAFALGTIPSLSAASLQALESASTSDDARLSRLARQALAAHS
jgi:HEAT repeats